MCCFLHLRFVFPPNLTVFVSVGTRMMRFPYPRYSLANSSYMVVLTILFHFCVSGIFLPFLHSRSLGIFLSACLLHFRSLESVGTDLHCFLHLRFVFPPELAVFRKRRYKNDAFSVPTLFQCTYPSLWSCFPCRSVAPSSCLAALIRPCCRTALDERL